MNKLITTKKLRSIEIKVVSQVTHKTNQINIYIKQQLYKHNSKLRIIKLD